MSSTQRPLTADEKAELAALTTAVDAALAARSSWLDVKMEQCSTLKVGDDIYDLASGHCLGKVTRLYRFNQGRDEGIRDTSVHCDYEYEMARLCFDNTSRQVGRSFGTREQAIAQAELQVKRIRDGAI